MLSFLTKARYLLLHDCIQRCRAVLPEAYLFLYLSLPARPSHEPAFDTCRVALDLSLSLSQRLSLFAVLFIESHEFFGCAAVTFSQRSM